MSTTVTYKGSTLTTATNQTRTLKTSGKYLEDDVVIVDSTPTTSLQTKSKTYTPTTSQQTDAVTADSGYDGLDSVSITVNAISPQRTSADATVSEDQVTVPNGYYPTAFIKTVASGTAGTPTATKGTVSNHSVSVTPKVTNTAGYITGGTKTGTAVSVSASELVSGSETKTANGTYDVTNLAELVVNVSGGTSRFVTGTFTTGSSAGASTLTIPYTGSGYPIMLTVCVEGGSYKTGTAWYNSTQRYAIGLYSMTKADFSTAPSYATSGTNNQGCVWVVFKNSTSSATSYSRNSSMTVNAYSTSNASNSVTTTFRFKSATSLSYYTNTSSYGLLPNTTYRYTITYSS